MNLGSSYKIANAGVLYIKEKSPSLSLATPECLKHTVPITSADYVEIITNSAGNLCQVYAPQTLADIVVLSDFAYEVRFYLPEQVGAKDGEGCYALSGDPFSVWKMENPDASTNEYSRFRITQLLEAQTNVFDFVWIESNQDWEFSKGNGLYVNVRTSEWDASHEERTDTILIKNDQDQAAFKENEVYRLYNWGTQLVEQVINPDGMSLTNTWAYYTDENKKGSYSKKASETTAAGGWKRYYYDIQGRKIVVVEAWCDAPVDSLGEDAKVTYYDYVSHDPLDVAASNDFRPRTVFETTAGTVTKKTCYAYFETNNTTKLIVDRCLHPDAAYGDTDNLRRISIYYGKTNCSHAEKGRLKSVVKPDGQMVWHAYELGTYTANGANPGTFSPGSGEFLRHTVTRGTAASSNGVAYKTTRDVTIQDGVGNDILREVYVFTGYDYERMRWTVQQYDSIGQITNLVYSNGMEEEKVWAAYRLTRETNDEGIEWEYEYDVFRRICRKTKKGIESSGSYPAQQDVITEYTYDANGNVLREEIRGGTLSLVVSNEYDLAGRIVKTVDPAGLITTWQYTDGGRRTVKTLPGGATQITEKYRDGRLKSATGSGVVNRYYEYGANTDGTHYDIVYTAYTNSPRWEKRTYNMIGKLIRTERPGYNGIITNSITHDSVGRLVKEVRSGEPAVLFEYDILGQIVRQGVDVNSSDTLDLVSMDRVTDTKLRYVSDGEEWYKETVKTVYPHDYDNLCVTQSVTRKTMVGCGCASISAEKSTTDIFGNQTVYSISIDRNTKIKTITEMSSLSTNPSLQTYVNGLLMTARDVAGNTKCYEYDTLGRRTVVADGRGVTNRTIYSNLGLIECTESGAGNRSEYNYDPLTGRRIVITDARSNVVYKVYDERGLIIGIWGATYPILYDYNDFERMIAMYTLRHDMVTTNTTYQRLRDDIASFDKTTWQYDPASGLLTNKLYADGNHTAYSYTLGGRLKERTWARGITSDYSYDFLGNLTNINYSDSTPDIRCTYNRLGQQLTIADVMGTRTNCYNSLGLLQSEKLPNGTMLSRLYDSLGRPAGISMGTDYLINYLYDPLGRFMSVTSSVCSMDFEAKYSYLTNSSLLAGYELSQATGPVLQVSRTYESRRDLIIQVRNTFGTNLISQFDYQNDAIGRRIRRIDSLVVTNDFAYNAISEISGADMGTNQYSYVYDPVGNRTGASANAISNLYTANELNQYVAISNSQSQQLMYDSDGNLTNDGGFAFSWNGENRLIKTESLGSVPDADKIRVENMYDYMGRRIRKTVSSGYSSGSYASTNVTTFIYDDWNVIMQTDATAIETNMTYYSYGLDLSGTRQGAGGVGGLLVVLKEDDETYSPLFDGNGNVAEYIDTSGTTIAHREYSPFGQTLTSSGAKGDFGYWFSTKYLDDEIDLYYYGYRSYNTEFGRWINRDPIGEKGFELIRHINHNPRTQKSGRVVKIVQPSVPSAPTNIRGFSHNIEHKLLRRVERAKMARNRFVGADPALKPPFMYIANNPISEVDSLGLDRPGCDLPFVEGRFLPACYLECCATHDECYDIFDCDSSSWCSSFQIITFDPCAICNAEVAGCMAGCAAGEPDADDPNQPNFYCAQCGVYFNDPNAHAGHGN